MSNLTWSKIGTLIVAGLGLIVQYTPQLQGAVTSLNLNPNVGLILTLLAGIATQILSAIHSHQLETIQNATPITGQTVSKTGLFLFVFLVLGSTVQAQSVEQQGFMLNPNFVAPSLFVQTAGNNYVLLPTAGLSLSFGYADVILTGNEYAVQKSLGLVYEENIGSTTTTTQAVNNAILGIQAGFKGINAVCGLQVLGPSLGGPGSSGLIFGASYDVTQLLPMTGFFQKF